MAEYQNESSDVCTHSQVASGVASVSIIAANVKRKGLVILNTDANALYLRFDGGTVTAATSNVTLAQNASYTFPFKFRGAITGLWAGDGTGHANVAEFT